jgi:threonine synthase
MNQDLFPDDVRDHILPAPEGDLVYQCLGCGAEFGIDRLFYTCPDCRNVLLIQDRRFDRLKKISGGMWRRILDYRKMVTLPQLKGIYRYHEFLGPVLPLDDILYLGEGHTPMIQACSALQQKVGLSFYFKNDGQNPSASFKDRGMASALSYINFMIRSGKTEDVLAICASTGDTSAAASLYAAYLHPHIKSAVLLPHRKVTPQQLSQPLGNGASVFEIPGVFDDCMKIVEKLSETYNVALLNSKNAWRILGQESYSYEIAQDMAYEMDHVTVVVPIGNAGNITAVLNGFIKFFQTGIIGSLPRIIGVQSEHADPVYQYYREEDPAERRFRPVAAKPSVAQAAMIGNPVSMPRVIHLVEHYDRLSGQRNVFFVQVTEQAIIDWQLTANRHGHIVCPHGGETLAGLVAALDAGIVRADDTAVLDSTAHALKFSGFQQMYFDDTFPGHYGITPRKSLQNAPVLVRPDHVSRFPDQGAPLEGGDLKRFVDGVTLEIARTLELKPRS